MDDAVIKIQFISLTLPLSPITNPDPIPRPNHNCNANSSPNPDATLADLHIREWRLEPGNFDNGTGRSTARINTTKTTG